jgi:hypothetical protein
MSMDLFRPSPQNVNVRLESSPPGADARTSLGPSCKTPCSVSVPVTDNFTVSYALDRFQPQTVAVKTTQIPGDFTNPASVATDPNPVFAELQPAGPPPRAHKGMKPKRVKKPKPAAAAGNPADTPFPDPNAAPPPPGTAAPSR